MKSPQITQKGSAAIAAAIIVAGLLIAGTIFVTLKDNQNRAGAPTAPEPNPTELADNIQPVGNDDYIRGNPDAPVKVVEFSDTECPFCKRFHPVMQQLMASDLGKEGKVAWVYRHFPLDALHQKARKEAEAVECAGKLGGNEAFWKYLDRLFEITPSNDGLDLAELPKIAEYVGLDVAAFNQCLSSGEFAEKVEKQLQDAIASGGRGTPYSVVIAPNGKKFIINGAQPYPVVRQIVEAALNEK